jgi:hypothetical protein
MPDNTQIHQELTKELTDLLDRFHRKNPDLFVERIGIYDVQDGRRRRVIAFVAVDIAVQPCSHPEANHA